MTNHNAAEKTVDFTIEKATPTTPTGLTATYGQTLADVTLPEGWEWKEPTTTSVGDVGTRMFPAKYTPTDENYNEVENVEVSITVSPAEAELSFDQPTLTITQRDAVPANALTKPDDCTVTYTSSEPTVATVVAETGEVTVVGVGTTTITATAGGNYTGSASYTLTVNAYILPYIPPTPDTRSCLLHREDPDGGDGGDYSWRRHARGGGIYLLLAPHRAGSKRQRGVSDGDEGLLVGHRDTRWTRQLQL